jgi:hypothetical protein
VRRTVQEPAEYRLNPAQYGKGAGTADPLISYWDLDDADRAVLESLIQ